MNERDEALMRDMLQAAQRAIGFVEGQERSDLEADNELLGFAVVRAIEIVGEAASKISVETRSQYPQIAWRQAIGMRNHTIHDYLNVDYDIVWDVVTMNLPQLVQQLKAILANPT
jgi:uncharacterized protein with HEPN domain